MSKKKIYLSPSNQYDNRYAYGNTTEMEQCNRFAEYAEKALKRCGFEVKRAKKGQAMTTSVTESNTWQADLHIPIHTNAGGGNGTVVFVYKKTAENCAKAQPIYNEVQAVTPGAIDYGVREYPELYELNATNAIAIYVEVDFHDNKSIAKWLIENAKKVGESIAKGVCKAYGVKYVADSGAPQKTNKIYRVQVGAFKIKSNAETCADKLKKSGFADTIIKEDYIND